jgi:type IV pilus assembly protein PilW
MNTFQRSQRGFSLVELMVAVAIALFLIGGVLTVFGNTRNTFKAQSSLAQLQDDQRLAMTLITDVVQAAGYFPNPMATTAANEFPTATITVGNNQSITFATAGQGIAGATNANAPGDVIAVRYETAGSAVGDNIVDCTGNVSPGAAKLTNTFSLDANNNLVCSVTNSATGQTAVQLVGGVTNLQIWYGLKTDFTVDNNQVDTYVPTSDMQAADWPNVISLRVILTFKNPLFGTPGQTKQTLDFTRVVAVMEKAGVKT